MENSVSLECALLVERREECQVCEKNKINCVAIFSYANEEVGDVETAG